MKIIVKKAFIMFVFYFALPTNTFAANTDVNTSLTENINWDSGESEINQIILNQKFGDLRLLQSNSNQVKIRAVVQRLKSSSKEVNIITEINEGVLEIDFDVGGIHNNDSKTIVRIDMAIFLPEKTKLKATIEKGTLMTKKISNDLMIESFNSNFDVNSTGFLDLYSQNGDVKVKISSRQSLSSKIKTSKGMISIFYDLKEISFDINSHGYITSNDWHLIKNKTGKKPNYLIYNTKGEPPIHLASDSGNIQLINNNIKEED